MMIKLGLLNVALLKCKFNKHTRDRLVSQGGLIKQLWILVRKSYVFLTLSDHLFTTSGAFLAIKKISLLMNNVAHNAVN